MTAAPHVQTRVEARTLSLPDAVEAVRARRDDSSDGWLRVVVPLEPVGLFDWLRGQGRQPRLFWGDRSQGTRSQGTRTAASGLAVQRNGSHFDVLDDLPRDDDGAPDGGLRAYLTCRFDLDAPSDESWQAFAPVSAWVPAVSIHERGTAQWLAVVFPPDGRAQDLLATAATLTPDTTGSDPVVPSHRTTGSDPVVRGGESARPAWQAGIERVLAEIDGQRLQKGVFTRRVVHRSVGRIDPVGILEHLDAQTDSAYRFLVQPDEETAFVGLSPERLYRRRANRIESEALAGTTRRGSAPEADAVLGEALMQSRKDRHEHDLVRQHIQDRLAPLAEELVFDTEPHLEQLEHVQHLKTNARGRLRAGVSDADVLTALHPTPAVCGLPTTAALDVLRQNEGFDRGLYCGLVGTWRPDEAEFAVAIRSALVQGNEIELYAGAGIVAGSDPDAEWEETVHKLRTIGDAIAPGATGEA